MPARRKPTAKKKLEGTARDDRANPNEPSYPVAAPPPPDSLSDEAREEWERLVPLMLRARTLTEKDAGTLADYCRLDAEIRDYDRRMGDGEKFLDEERKKYPLAIFRNAAINSRRLCANELGLTPAANSKVSSLGNAEESDPMAVAPRAHQSPQRRGKSSAERVN